MSILHLLAWNLDICDVALLFSVGGFLLAVIALYLEHKNKLAILADRLR